MYSFVSAIEHFSLRILSSTHIRLQPIYFSWTIFFAREQAKYGALDEGFLQLLERKSGDLASGLSTKTECGAFDFRTAYPAPRELCMILDGL